MNHSSDGIDAVALPVSGRPAVRSRPRALFVGSMRYDLPLSPGLARKWAAIEGRVDVRVIGRAGIVEGDDPRFRLLPAAPIPMLGGAPFYAALPAAVGAEIRRFRPDVVIAQSPYEAFALLARPRKPAGPKLIVELHGDWRTAARLYGSRFRRAFARLADRAALFAIRRADATRALSPFTAGLAEEATGNKPLAAFTTYFDLESFTAEPPRPLPAEPAVAWIGVLEHYKDPRTLVEAWRIVAPQIPQARLTIVGQGPLQPTVNELAGEFPSRVRTVSRLEPSAVARLLDETTLLAMSSAQGAEGVPRVIMEAFTRGRPVVCTAVGGIPDLVEPERNGLLVEPRNPLQLAAALVRVLRDRELAARLADGAHEDAQRSRWSAEGHADAVRDMVDRVVAHT